MKCYKYSCTEVFKIHHLLFKNKLFKNRSPSNKNIKDLKTKRQKTIKKLYKCKEQPKTT